VTRRWLFFVALLAVAGLLLLFGGIAMAQQRVPLASEIDTLLSPLAISLDHKTFTFRGVAPDDLTVCVEPSKGAFAPVRCFVLRDIRRGSVVKK
jgi:hypothetical protein